MPHNVTTIQNVLVGVGKMGKAYAEVLKKLNVDDFTVIGRSEEGVQNFKATMGIEALAGGFDKYVDRLNGEGAFAIVAVNEEKLAATTLTLLDKGYKKILLEKPGAVTKAELKELLNKMEAEEAEIFIAYNRRFYGSVEKAAELIAEDGGVTSFHFEFTEWSSVIEEEEYPAHIKEKWFVVNSSHIADMAFFLGGRPKTMQSYTLGQLAWHPSASRFAGCGESESGALFTYNANWKAPGRWSVEVMTARFRYVFCPLEKLVIQGINSIDKAEIELDHDLDIQFKPGIYRQTEAFLQGNFQNLKRLKMQLDDFEWYYKIANYQDSAI